MAKHAGRGLAAIEYPTGMNQNGDPSQAWVKLKPDGRVDVFAGTVDIGQGSRTVHTQIVADALGVPYDWVTMDNTNTDSSPVCTGTLRLSRHVHRRQRRALRGRDAPRSACSRSRPGARGGPRRSRRRGRRGVREGRPQKQIGVDDVAAAATWGYGELITGTGAALKPYAVVDPEDGSVTIEPHSAISYAACVADVEVDDETGEVRVERLVQVYDVGRAINPTLVEGQIHGGAMMGLGLGLLEACYPYYPSTAHRGGEFGTYLAPSMEQLPEIQYVILENAVGGRAVRREGDRRDGVELPGAGDRDRRPRRDRRLDHGDADHPGEGAAGARAQGRRRGRPAPRGQARDLRRGDLGQRLRVARREGAFRGARLMASPFRTWNGVPQHEFVDGVRLHAIGGEQVLLCRVTYEPGKKVPLHSHDHTEQVMVIVDGSVDMAIEGEWKTLAAGDVVVVNRGLEHELYSKDGVTFLEALAPVPLDHVPDRERDLVLGPDGGTTHVER